MHNTWFGGWRLAGFDYHDIFLNTKFEFTLSFHQVKMVCDL